jgi:amino acid adenylation domain-containing protein
MTEPPAEDSYELSPLQHGMLLDSLAGGEPGVDVVQVVCHLDEDVDAEALARAWRRVVARHTVLRTAFRLRPSGEPVQDVYREVDLPFESVDLGPLPPDAAEHRFAEIVAADRRRGFDLFRLPLTRLTLARVGPARQRLLWTTHHAVLDGEAVAPVLREAFSSYDAERGGRALELPAPRPFADYIRWQSGLDGKAAEVYWRAALRGLAAPTKVDLPRAAAGAPTDGLGASRTRLTKDETSHLAAFARSSGVTLGTLVHGAWALLLHHYSGEREVVFGSVRTLRRSMPDAERIVGPLVNTLPVRVVVDRSVPLLAWLRERRAAQTALRAHAHWPLSLIRSYASLPPGAPLFESLVLVDVATVDGAVRRLGGEWSRRRFELVGRSSYPLVLSAFAEPELLLEVKNDRIALDDATGAAMLEQVRGLLEQMPAGGERPLGALSLLSPAQRKRVVEDLNRTDRPYPRERCLHELVEIQAARTPDAVAVEAEAGRLTYRELDERANRLARHLRRLGVAPGGLAGIAMERSLEVVVGLLAILKAGAAYVPLDPTYPADRLALMASDSQVPLVLTSEGLAERIPTAGARVVAVEARASEIAAESADPLGPSVGSDALAYVIYTSGSTGRPKGAMNPHRGIVNRLLWMQDEYGLGPDDAVLQKAPFSFDVSVWETFWPLLSGARLVMARPEGHMDPAYIARTIQERRITVVQFVPAMLRAFLDEPRSASCSSLRRVFSGGEALSVELRDLFFDRLGHCALDNLYGPTETAVAVTFHPCRRDDRRRVVPIGRPLPNTRIYVLDPWLDPVPAGAAGELHVGGVQVGRGYARRPGLTAERFVPDPFSPEPGARLYRTGDLARWLPDGSLEYLGRIDHQVKLRGFRIELGEIESTLARHPDVRQAVVVTREPGTEHARLVAYLTSDAAPPPTPPALRAHLGRSLPAHMVPSSFVLLDHLPLTPSGKVDRKALPAPDAPVEPAASHAAMPMTPTEEILAGAWSELLGVEGIGAEDDFFARGGHSLLATQVVSRVRRAFGVELPLRDLFAERTVSRLARRIDALCDATSASRAGAGSGTIPRREPRTRRDLSAAERRLWFFDQVEPNSSAYNLGVRLQLTGSLDRAVLERSLGVLVERHETLRTSFRADLGAPFAVVAPRLALEVPFVDLRDRPADGREAEAERLIASAEERPFDLEAAPLIRALLVRVGDDQYRLGLAVHHVVSDGWALDVLTRELLAAYAALAEGRPPALPPLRISYADYAAWEGEWLLGSEAERQRGFWRERLAGPLPVVDLPADHPRPRVQTYRGGVVEARLSPHLDARLAALSRGQGVTAFMSHLAAFGLLLGRLTGLEDLPVGVPVAGRGHEELEDLVGIFINTVVVRHDLSGDPTFLELLRRTRTLALEAYRHSQLPFDRIVEDLHPRRTASRSPLFQVLVNSVDFRRSRRFELPGLVAERGPSVVRHSRFDLTLYLGREAGRAKLVLAYNSDLFDDRRMGELLREYEAVLEQVVAAPDRPVSEVSLVTTAARAVLPDPLRPLGGTAGPTVAQAVVSRAREDPERVAVVGPSERLTYTALERRSRWLAQRLGDLGVVRGDIVAIHARRDVELVWAMVGVLRAGAAFAILDAAHPPSRLAECLRAAKPKALVRCSGLDAARPETAASLPSVSLAHPGDGSSPRGDGADAPAGAADDLAYVAFTSGTTGGVKGVLGTHGPLSHFLRWQRATFGLVAEDRFSMLSGLGHDPLLRDVFTPIHLGAPLFVPDPALLTSPDGLRAFLANAGVTVAHLTPSHANLLAEGAAPGELPRLRYAFLAGDVLDGVTVDRLRRLAPAITIVNFYGATETPQAMGWHVVPHTPRVEPAPVPLGRGIDDVQLLVLGGGGRLAGVGELGQIAVRTPHLARGYLDDERLTRERFVASPFTKDPADRVYLTGDLGRFRPDGLVEFAGRRDGQVKIRGFRVELQAVESVLREHPSVGQAVVVCHAGEETDAAGEPRLAAYVTGEAGQRPAASPLRAFLEARLPGYMVPASFVTLDSLPLTPNGKVDRRAVARIPPAPAAAPHLPPRTATERLVATAWAEALGSAAPSVDDSFFDVGGHSLAAARLIARLRTTFGVALGVRSLFERPTIAGLSELLDALTLSRGPGVPPEGSSPREELEF